ncbi:MAG TPA: TolC family protein, partial [Gemmatimonadaceae bacterium]|nr:TolC family protein [Gemmatimonadaceae bacterium]
EEVRLARSQVDLAETQVTSARSVALPQISGSLNYTRTFQSPYAGSGAGFQIPDSLRFQPDSNASMAERIRYLEQNAPNAGLEGLGGLFGNLPFGQEHAYVASVNASQLLYSGGRTGAAMKIAKQYGTQARLGFREQLSGIELDVRTAYYHALLARELEDIAAAAVEQAQRFLDQERLRFLSGSSSELDVLRAEVSLENLRPQLVEARNASELATLDLKRLVNIPVTQPLALTTRLEEPPLDSGTAAPMVAEKVDVRPAVQSAETQVAIREQQVSIAKGAYLPSVNLQLNYGRQLWPSRAFNWSGADWRPDFTASIGVTVPIFSGFKRGADVELAQVELRQSQLQLSQLREAVQLEYERARGERERARSSIAARRRTVDQAQRVYDLTVLRYEKGLATQLETSDARLALLQARTNLAQAISDYYVADAQMMKALGATSAPEQ